MLSLKQQGFEAVGEVAFVGHPRVSDQADLAALATAKPTELLVLCCNISGSSRDVHQAADARVLQESAVLADEKGWTWR